MISQYLIFYIHVLNLVAHILYIYRIMFAIVRYYDVRFVLI